MSKRAPLDVGDDSGLQRGRGDRQRSSRAVGEALEARGGELEIIVVDNASEDDTVDRLPPFLGDRRVRLLRNEHNLGKGFSVRRGMLEATGDLRLMCDADCAPSLASLPAMEAHARPTATSSPAPATPRARRSGASSPLRRARRASASSSCAGAVMSEPLQRRVLRLQAVHRRGRAGRVLTRAHRRLGV